jgi:hypothetical protein
MNKQMTTSPLLDLPPKPKKKRQKKRIRLDGKQGRPRGRHAVPRAEGEPAPVAAPLRLMLRLGYRVGEYAALTSTSVSHVWRGIHNKTIKTVDVNGVTLIPRAFVIEQGLITKDDSI